MKTGRKQIVVLGAGFGGLEFCKQLGHPDADITLIDRQNHHLFQPLLYQVATAGLSATDIAQPIRSILAHLPQVTVLLDEVTGFRLAEKQVILGDHTRSYDYLVIALGGCTSYFGHPEWERFAPGLKSLQDALQIRNRILLAFEQAESDVTPERHSRLLTIVVIGGGPTGVELAGACAELCRHVLQTDFRHIHTRETHIILLEAAPRILAHLPPELSASARRQLEALGVQVRTDTKVKAITADCVELETGEIIRARTILWGAGVAANPLTRQLGVPLDRAGRIQVNPDRTLPGHPEVFAIGDLAAVLTPEGTPVPGVSPAAIQMARHVAGIIGDELAGHHLHAPRQPFHYHDKGTMATIGRSAAVAKIGRLEFSGFPAWLAWLGVHLLFLVGFRNKVTVLFQWFYSYLTYKRGARIITQLPPPPGPPPAG